MIRRKWLVIALVLLLLYSLFLSKDLLGVSSSGASPINPSFKGTGLMVSYLKELGYLVKVVNYPEASELGSGGVLMIVSPERNFTLNELDFIRDAFLRNYSLIIADEGPYSNTLLGYLNIPIKIIQTPYFLRNHFPYARIKLEEKEYVLGLAYASALKVSGGAEPAGWSGNEVVMAIYKVNDEGKVIALGDGSVFTNAALTPLDYLNPYVRFLNSIIKFADEGKPKEVLILASPYPKRPLSIEEMISAGYSPVQVWAALINPYRIGVGVIHFLSKPSPPSVLIYGTLLLTALLIIRSSLRLSIYSVSPVSVLRRYWDERHLVKSLCAEGRNLLSHQECLRLLRLKKDKEIIEELNNYIIRRPELILRVIEFFSSNR